MNKNETELWDRYQTEFRYLYDRKQLIKPVYPIIYLIKQYYSNLKTPIDKRIAEIGFGNGGALRSLSYTFRQCYGLDISPKNIEYTKKLFDIDNIANVVFDVYDVMDYSKHVHFFDCVLASHVLEHFDDEELVKVLFNIKTMLKLDGILFGAVPLMKELNPRICPKCGHAFEIDGHKQVYDESKMRKLLEVNGFDVLVLRNFNPDHFYYKESLIFKIYHRLFVKNKVTQLEFVAKVGER